MVQNAKRVFAVSGSDILKFFCFLLPGGRKLMNTMGISIFKTEETLYFYDILKSSVEKRWVLFVTSSVSGCVNLASFMQPHALFKERDQLQKK